MANGNIDARKLSQKLYESRIRLLTRHPFFGYLLTSMKMMLDPNCQTAYTDGDIIAFSPAFLDKLSSSETDFVLMHELMHDALDHCHRGVGPDRERWNIAADIVVNSNILKSNGGDVLSITVDGYESMHIAPDGKEGYLYTLEEVYEQLILNANKSQLGDPSSSLKDPNSFSDDHTHWSKEPTDLSAREQIERNRKLLEAVALEQKRNERLNQNGFLPLEIERMIKNIRSPEHDWRRILNDFIQEEINDYSFLNPDNRFQDSPFILPSFSDADATVKDILFMVDTSGSMSQKMIDNCFSEIKGAIEQFNGKLRGKIGFFDAAIHSVDDFDETTIDESIPTGGGGTNFSAVFDYVNEKMKDEPPLMVIILTDGYADFPKENPIKEIPLLWVINNKKVNPPFGVVARIS